MPDENLQSSHRSPPDMAALDPRTGRVTITLPNRTQMEKEVHSYYYPPGF